MSGMPSGSPRGAHLCHDRIGSRIADIVTVASGDGETEAVGVIVAFLSALGARVALKHIVCRHRDLICACPGRDACFAEADRLVGACTGGWQLGYEGVRIAESIMGDTVCWVWDGLPLGRAVIVDAVAGAFEVAGIENIGAAIHRPRVALWVFAAD